MEGLGVGRRNKRCACRFTPPRPQLALRATLPVKGRVGQSARLTSPTKPFSLAVLHLMVSCRVTALSSPNPNATARYDRRVKTQPDGREHTSGMTAGSPGFMP